MVLQSDNYEYLQLRFSGVQGIEIEDLDSMCCLLLEIRDIRDKQWVDVNYRVIDVENEIVDFNCKKIEEIEVFENDSK